MLKIFFGVAGVLFVGLGLFGGSVLEGFSGADKIKPTAQMQASESETVETAAVVTTASVSDNSSSATQAAAAPQVVAASIAAKSSVLKVQDQTTGQQSVEKLLGVVNIADETTESVESVVPVSAVPVADNSGGEGAEPIAPAQAAGDLVTMTEQAKSSTRNEQVNMAKAVLTSNAQPSADGSVVVDITEADKSVEVAAAIKSTVGGAASDPLTVIKDKVNLRDGPSIDHPIVLTLQQGQELMEFKREGKWVHVGAYGTSGKIGWVHERLVGPVAP